MQHYVSFVSSCQANGFSASRLCDTGVQQQTLGGQLHWYELLLAERDRGIGEVDIEKQLGQFPPLEIRIRVH